MKNIAIQMELLSDMRTLAQAFNYELARERGQQNQNDILRGINSNWKTTVAHLSARKTKPAILPTPHKKNNTRNAGDAEGHSNRTTTTIVLQKYHNGTFAKNQDTLQKCADHKYLHFLTTEDSTRRDNKHKQEM